MGQFSRLACTDFEERWLKLSTASVSAPKQPMSCLFLPSAPRNPPKLTHVSPGIVPEVAGVEVPGKVNEESEGNGAGLDLVTGDAALGLLVRGAGPDDADLERGRRRLGKGFLDIGGVAGWVSSTLATWKTRLAAVLSPSCFSTAAKMEMPSAPCFSSWLRGAHLMVKSQAPARLVSSTTG
jgi:hypothetical protein